MSLIERVKVKLGVSVDGETIYRRIDLSRHGEFGGGKGQKLYEALKLYAVQSHTGAHDLPNVNMLPQYKVTLWYLDADGDKVMVGSPGELRDALLFFDNKKVAKLMADVQETQGSSSKFSSRASSATQTTDPTAAKEPEVDVEVPPIPDMKEASTPPHQISGLVESVVVGVLGPALSSIRLAADHAARVAAEAEESAARRALTASNKPKESNTQASKDDSTDLEEKAADKNVKPEDAKHSAEEPEDVPFIHGRHTCDGCLTTPIVGKRFHAVNLPDYDLCEKCKNNYTGDEIKFEEAELADRDRAFQGRWHRRHTKWAQTGRHPNGCRFRRGFGPFPRGPHGGPRRPHGPSRHAHMQRSQCGVFGIPAPHAGPSPDEVDAALKEALRRSLKDYMAKEDDKEKTSKKKESVKAKEDESQNKMDSNVAPSEPDENKESTTEAPESEARSEGVAVASPSASVKEVDTSFTLDAEGSGEVAMAMGAAFDKVAQAIDEMSDELDRKPAAKDTSTEVDIVVEPSAPAENTNGTQIVQGEEEEVSATDDGSRGSWQDVDDQFASDEALARAAQVIGSALFNSDIVQSTDNVSTLSRSEGVASDSSASSGRNSSFSSVGSVPTTVPSLATETRAVAPAQSERWAIQLEQLHELGFHNDALLVDTLERLNAANIGVESNDEVTVQQVVNVLMRDM